MQLLLLIFIYFSSIQAKIETNDPSICSSILENPENYEYTTIPNLLSLNKHSNETVIYDHYKIVKVIGEGFYGKIFKAIDFRTNKSVALKVTKYTQAKKHMSATIEVKIMNILKDAPNMVSVLGTYQHKSSQLKFMMIVMDLFDGQSIKEYFGSLTNHQIKHTIYQTLRTLTYAEERNILHKDLNLGNIMLNLTTNEVKLIDWGMSMEYPKGILTKSSDVYELGHTLFNITMGNAGIKYDKPNYLGDEYKRDVLTTDKEDTFSGILSTIRKKSLEDFINKYNLQFVEDLLWDLLDKMFSKKITAKAAISHSYFDQVRET